MTSLDDLLRRALRRLYAAHGQGAQQMTVDLSAASAGALRRALQAGMTQNTRQIERLERVFNLLKLPVAGEHDAVMAGVSEDGNAAIREIARSPELDQEIIRGGQLAAHVYLANYGTARGYAEALGERKAAKLLQKTLDEFGRVDRRYTKLADKLRAQSAGGGVKDAAKVLAAAGAVAGGYAWLNRDKVPARSTGHVHVDPAPREVVVVERETTVVAVPVVETA